jgi:RND family efflux transporter MFP subunit
MSNEALVTQPNTPLLPLPSRKSGARFFLLAPIVLCLVGAVALLLRAQESRKLAVVTHALQAEPVSIIHPQSGAPNSDLALPSTIQAFSDSPIYARTNGYVAHWYADIGTHVHQGQLLAVIESPEVDQELSQARASLNQVQATLTLAGITAKRYQGLISTNAVSQQDVDQNNQNLEAQKANLQAATANVSRLQQMQGFERVVAPFDGIITQRRTDIGDLVNAGNGGVTFELFRISKINTVRIFVPVPETYSEQITNGLKATLELTALPGKQFQGSVVRSSHAIDAASHTLLTETEPIRTIDAGSLCRSASPSFSADTIVDHSVGSRPLPSRRPPSRGSDGQERDRSEEGRSRTRLRRHRRDHERNFQE